MPDIDSMKTSNYLKKEDVGQGVPVTIQNVVEGNIAQDGKPVDMKWLIYFNEFEKPLVSNVTHREQIAAYLGSRNSDHWIGKPVILWNDPSVVFGSNVGGIRVRPAQQATMQQPPIQQGMAQGASAIGVPPQAPNSPTFTEDDIPF